MQFKANYYLSPKKDKTPCTSIILNSFKEVSDKNINNLANKFNPANSINFPASLSKMVSKHLHYSSNILNFESRSSQKQTDTCTYTKEGTPCSYYLFIM